MRHRRRHLAVLLVAAAAVCVGLLPLAPPAAAAPVTNACISGATATYSDIAITFAGTGSPDPVAAGGTVTLAGTSVTLDVPGTLFLAGYRIFLLNVGANTIPADGAVTIAATGATPATATQTKSASPTVTITDPTPANRSSGDESASSLTVTLPLDDTTWTSTGGTIEFREVSVNVDALINGTIPVALDCAPGSSSADGTTFTPATPAPFETVAIAGATSTTTSSSTSTSSGSSTTSTTGSSTTSTTRPSSTTTTVRPSTTTTAGVTTTTRPSTSTTSASTSTTSVATTGTTAAAGTGTLPAGRADMTYSCRGADIPSQGVLDTLGSLATPPVPPPNRLDLSVLLTSDAITSPAAGAAFQLPLRWTVSLPATVVAAAQRLQIASIAVSDTALVAGVESGASGPDSVLEPPDRVVTLASASGFSAGPATASWVRTGAPGVPVVVLAKQVRLTATVNLGATPLVIALLCDPPAQAKISLVEGGVTPSAPAGGTQVLSSGASRTVASSSGSLARTGFEYLTPLALAVILLDLGYLSISAPAAAATRDRALVPRVVDPRMDSAPRAGIAAT